jgi:hypothetical protein
LAHVLTHLSKAQFDPEFSKHHEVAILEAYNNQSGANIHPFSNSTTAIL